MSSLYGGANEAERMYKGYQTSGMNGNCVFHIPVFKRMPSTCSLLNLSDARDAVHFTKVTEKAKAKAEETRMVIGAKAKVFIYSPW